MTKLIVVRDVKTNERAELYVGKNSMMLKNYIESGYEKTVMFKCDYCEDFTNALNSINPASQFSFSFDLMRISHDDEYHTIAYDGPNGFSICSKDLEMIFFPKLF